MTVHLVGAGPGDPELITVKALRLLSRADVVVYDRLVSPEILDMAAPWAELINVGKDPNGARTTQDQINQILIERGHRYDTVVRLKGGDPFVFGRGGEEAIALEAKGIAVTVVPGITSSIAGPAMAGIPVTHRNVSSAFTVVTAHENPAKTDGLNWNALARLNTTLVVLMGARRAAQIRNRLLDAGMAGDTPVAIVVSASTPDQQVNRLTLADLGVTPVPNPAVIVIGEVAAAPVITGLPLTNHPSVQLAGVSGPSTTEPGQSQRSKTNSPRSASVSGPSTTQLGQSQRSKTDSPRPASVSGPSTTQLRQSQRSKTNSPRPTTAPLVLSERSPS